MSVAVISAEFRTGVGNPALRQHPPALVNSRAAPPLAPFDAAVRAPEYIGLRLLIRHPNTGTLRQSNRLSNGSLVRLPA